MKQLFLMFPLILVGCTLASDREPVPLEARLTEKYTNELNRLSREISRLSRQMATYPYKGLKGAALRRAQRIDLHYYQMTRGYDEIVKKVDRGRDQLVAEHGDVERGLIALGCRDQAPGIFRAVLRSGDVARDYWCSRKVGKRFERARTD